MMWIVANYANIVFVNKTVPFIALIGLAVVLFSQRWQTAGKLVSTILHLKIVYWVLLVWADWGSTIFHPTLQTMFARVMMLIILIFFLKYVKQNNPNGVNHVN